MATRLSTLGDTNLAIGEQSQSADHEAALTRWGMRSSRAYRYALGGGVKTLLVTVRIGEERVCYHDRAIANSSDARIGQGRCPEQLRKCNAICAPYYVWLRGYAARRNFRKSALSSKEAKIAPPKRTNPPAKRTELRPDVQKNAP